MAPLPAVQYFSVRTAESGSEMASSLRRLPTTILEMASLRLGLGSGLEKSLSHWICTSSRCLCSSGQQQSWGSEEEASISPRRPPATEDKDGNEIEQKADADDDGEGDGDGANVNKATGEIGGPRGPEPTRYGDWERGGRCSDF